MAADRIVTVSTVKDKPANIARFVERNLGSGVDHMIVFLDANQPRVRSMFESHPNVTVFQTGPDYWRGDRPTVVMDRQMVNANIACTALAGSPSVRWLFHIDADEALSFDRDALLRLDARAVLLPTLEAVAQREWDGGEVRLFKRIPELDELRTMSALGRLDVPHVDSFFRGHSLGKSGVLPAEGVRFRIHTVYELPDRNLEAVTPPGMHLLHYETCTFEDFLARWRDYDPQQAGRRPFKNRRLGAAFHLLANDPRVGRAERERRLGELFDRYVADDPETLRLFDLVVHDPRRPAEPRLLPADEVARLESALDELGGADKSDFRSTLIRGPRYAVRTDA